MTFPAISPRDLTDSRVVFGRAPAEYAIDRDRVRALCLAREIARDGLDTSATQAAIITTIMGDNNVRSR